MKQTVGFRLIKISTEQFAVLKEMYVTDVPFAVYTELSFGAEKNDRIVVVSALFRFKSDEKGAPFIILETKAFFDIKPESWDNMYDAENNTLSIEKDFARHISVITVGTARGILHAKTEGTELNNIVLPLINIEEIMKENVILHFK